MESLRIHERRHRTRGEWRTRSSDSVEISGIWRIGTHLSRNVIPWEEAVMARIERRWRRRWRRRSRRSRVTVEIRNKGILITSQIIQELMIATVPFIVLKMRKKEFFFNYNDLLD